LDIIRLSSRKERKGGGDGQFSELFFVGRILLNTLLITKVLSRTKTLLFSSCEFHYSTKGSKP
jgi:hypothetical protein